MARRLTPDVVLNALESAGLRCDGRLLALGSYENRVYQVGIEEDSGEPALVVAKFYRPNRWSDEQILEEHAFARELADSFAVLDRGEVVASGGRAELADDSIRRHLTV